MKSEVDRLVIISLLNTSINMLGRLNIFIYYGIEGSVEKIVKQKSIQRESGKLKREY